MKKRFPRSSSTIYHSPYGETTYKPGFTIIELLVVIVIIAILAAISIVTYGGVQNRAVATSLQSDLTNASDQLVIDQAHSNTGVFPATLEAASSTIKWSGNPTPVYTVNNTNTPKTFCLTATKSNQSYFITQEGLPMPGPCPVLYLDAGITTSYPGTGTTWTDLSGNRNNGTMYGGVTYSSTNGGALNFNGSSGYINIPSTSTTAFGTGDFSISYWLKYPITQSVSYAGIVGLNGTDVWSDNVNAVILTQYSTNTNYVELFDATTGDASTWRNSFVIFSSIPNGWHYFVVARTNSAYLGYLDGVLVTNHPISTIVPIDAGTTFLMRQNSRYTGGQINNVRVNSRALTATEITQNYNALKSRFGL